VSDGDTAAGPQAVERWRRRKAKVVEAQKKLYQDVRPWSSLPPERGFNEVILPALRSGKLVGPSELCFDAVVVAAFRVCEAAAHERGVNLEDHVPSDIREIVKDAGDVYHVESGSNQTQRTRSAKARPTHARTRAGVRGLDLRPRRRTFGRGALSSRRLREAAARQAPEQWRACRRFGVNGFPQHAQLKPGPSGDA
jgi:hypothetical protein